MSECVDVPTSRRSTRGEISFATQQSEMPLIHMAKKESTKANPDENNKAKVNASSISPNRNHRKFIGSGILQLLGIRRNSSSNDIHKKGDLIIFHVQYINLPVPPSDINTI